MTTLVLRQCSLYHVLIKLLLRQHSTTSSLRFFEHVQSSSTSSTLMESIPRPYRFVLRSYYDVGLQVLTAFTQFFEDIVGTWPQEPLSVGEY